MVDRKAWCFYLRKKNVCREIPYMDATTMIIGLLFVIIIAMWVDLLAQRFSWWNSLLGKLAGWKETECALPWYARSDAQYALPTTINVTPTYEVENTGTGSTTPHKANLEFDLSGVLTKVGKDKFVAGDVTVTPATPAATLSPDGKKVTVTIENPVTPPSSTVTTTAKVKLPDSVLLLDVSIEAEFTVSAGASGTGDTLATGDIEWSVSLQIGESDNEVLIDSDTFAAAT
jgi:hypothetical protein